MNKALVLGALLLLSLLVGCQNSPLDSPADTATATFDSYLVAGETQVQFAARVAVTDANRRMLLFAGHPDTVIALENCEIVRLNGSDNAPVPFTEIHPGDSLSVTALRTQDQTMLAQRLQICTPGQGCYDVAIRDEITAIDYAAGTFTVATRTETITIDANTVIWANLTQLQEGSLTRGGDNSTQVLGEGDHYRAEHDTLLAFTDLKVGDIIELRADVVDEATLLAGIIKVVPECLSKCVNFTDYLASIDVETRVVTFQTESWTGTVCPGAQLIGLDGEELTLADFAAGDYVTIKGYPLEDGTLKISQMTKTVEP